MPSRPSLAAFATGASVSADVWDLRPDYRALLLVVDGLTPGPSDAASDRLLRHAEQAGSEALAATPPEGLPHVAAWRDAYRAFGAKPQRTRNSLEALLRRVPDGLPRVDRLTDTYNAISVLHRLPLGGEDLASYDGPPRLVRASGAESFVTSVNGEPVADPPETGEVIWRDRRGATCRRWNWRQSMRTRLSEYTTAAVFILDALAPLDDPALLAAGDDLLESLGRRGATITSTVRLLAPAAAT